MGSCADFIFGGFVADGSYISREIRERFCGNFVGEVISNVIPLFRTQALRFLACPQCDMPKTHSNARLGRVCSSRIHRWPVYVRPARKTDIKTKE